MQSIRYLDDHKNRCDFHHMHSPAGSASRCRHVTLAQKTVLPAAAGRRFQGQDRRVRLQPHKQRQQAAWAACCPVSAMGLTSVPQQSKSCLDQTHQEASQMWMCLP
jgi:hypothetical protein